ncbi:MAG: oligosaccharide flippase family protein [Nitrospirota bacterium]
MLKQARNFLFLYSTQIFINSVSFLFNFILGKTLTPENFGMFRYILGIGPLALSIASFGIDVKSIQDTAEEKLEIDRIISDMLPFKFISILLILLFMITILSFGTYGSRGYLVAVILGLGLWLQDIINVGNSVFKGLQHMGKVSLIQLSQRIGEMSFTMVVIFIGIPSVSNISIGYVTGDLIAVIVTFGLLRKYFKNIQLKISNSLILFRKASPYYVANIFNFLNLASISIILDLAAKNSQKQQGLYQSAYLFASVAMMTELTLSLVVFPAMISKYSKERQNYLETTNNYLLIFILAAIFFSTALYMFPKEAVILFLNNKYIEAVPIIKILGISLIFSFFFEIPAWHLTVSGHQIERTRVIVFTSIVTPFFTFFLVRNLGGIGAGLSVLLNFICQWILYTVYAYKCGWRFRPTKRFYMIFLVTCVTFLSTYLARNQHLIIWAFVLCSSYFGSILILKPIPTEMMVGALLPNSFLESKAR